MYGSGRHMRRSIGVWPPALLIGIVGVMLGSGLAYGEPPEGETQASMDSTTMHGHATEMEGMFDTGGMDSTKTHDHKMEMGEGREHQGDKKPDETSGKEQKITHWTCGMHPSVRAEEPGKCPICAMNLVPVYEQGTEDDTLQTSSAVQIKLSPREVQLADVRTDRVMYRSLYRNLRTIGKVAYDERKLAHIAAWVGGRVDRLFVNYTGAEVVKGQPLLEIYSPDLVMTQEEYLLALETLDKVGNSRIPETIEGARWLVQAARKRLLLWGILEQQIEELERDLEVKTHMIMYAPTGGIVIKKMVKEGMYVMEGHVLFDIADLSTIWVMADMYESELSWIRTGQMVEIGVEAYPGETFMGHITFVDPFLNPQTRSVEVRIEVPNAEMKLKPEMFADVDVHVPTGEVLTVPKTAILDTGPRKIAYLDQGDGRFVGVEVTIGHEAEGFYLVLGGLSPGDKVVTTANFLIDSQTQLLTGASALYGGAKEIKDGEAPPPPPGHQH